MKTDFQRVIDRGEDSQARGMLLLDFVKLSLLQASAFFPKNIKFFHSDIAMRVVARPLPGHKQKLR